LAGWLKPSAITESVLKTHYNVEMMHLNLFLTGFFILARRFNASYQVAAENLITDRSYTLLPEGLPD
jgi:hypothetical protein